jgi:Zn-dependent peptidase ImmA (M78 family)
MPANEVLASPHVQKRGSGHEWTIDELIDAAKPFGVSVESFLRRLADLGRVPMTYYQQFRSRQTEEEARGTQSGKGEFYRTKARDVGKGYVRAVTDAYDRHLIDTTTTAGFLGVKAGQIAKLAETARL